MKKILVIWLLLFTYQGYAQDEGYFIKKSRDPILIDGILDEPDWTRAQIADNFYEYFPADSIPSIVQTNIRLTYDDQNLYFSAVVFDKTPNHRYVTPSLRRDFRGEAFDGVTLVLDPFQDNTNAFMFGVSPFGVQREGIISNGDNLSLDWDNKWYTEVKQYDGYWTAEAAIPFKTLRFNGGAEKWNVNFYRIDSETAERSSWSRIPRNFPIVSLAFMRELVWDEPLAKAGSNVSVIPFTAGVAQRDFTDPNQTSGSFNMQFGGDAKVAISSGLNLDVTVNPDFSQVEVDQQVTNLDRFEIFFPERRQFFLENADLFSDFGHPLARPFFSRRIGVAQDSSTGQNIQNPIPLGVRLSGKLNNDWRVGLLNMQTADNDAIGLPGINHTVAVLQRKVFARSNIGGIFVNRQITEDAEGNFTMNSGNFNRVAGMDYNLASADGKWSGKAFYHRSFGPENLTGQYSSALWIDYRTPGLRFNYALVAVGENYDAANGFVPRTGFVRTNPEIGYFLYPKSKIINNHGVVFDTEFFWDRERKTDHRHTMLYRITFQNTALAIVRFNQRFTYLFNSFDPTNTGGERLAADTEYTYHDISFFYHSDYRKNFSIRTQGSIGQYFNGNRQNIGGELLYRTQPYGSIGMTFNYNRLVLPTPYTSANLVLIGPRFDFTMTRSLFFTTFIQYNNQIDNVNINARLQWRFKPVSDFFLVYTDNYGTNNGIDQPVFLAKNRALVFKMTYWLNL